MSIFSKDLEHHSNASQVDSLPLVMSNHETVRHPGSLASATGLSCDLMNPTIRWSVYRTFCKVAGNAPGISYRSILVSSSLMSSERMVQERCRWKSKVCPTWPPQYKLKESKHGWAKLASRPPTPPPFGKTTVASRAESPVKYPLIVPQTRAHASVTLPVPWR